MKVQKLNKKILGLLVLFVTVFAVYSFLTPTALAKDDKKKDDKDTEEKQEETIQCKKAASYNFAEKYGLSIDYVPPTGGSTDGSFVVKMDLPDELKSKSKSIKFKIVEIFATDISRDVPKDGKTVTYDNTYSDKVAGVISTYSDITSEEQLKRFHGLTSNELTNGKTVTFISRATSSISNTKINRVGGDDRSLKFFVVLAPVDFKDSELTGACGKNATFLAVVQYSWYGDPGGGQDTVNIDIPQPPASSGYIECENYATKFTDHNSFEYLYCHTRQLALDSGVEEVHYSNATPDYSSKFPNQTASYACNAFDVTSTRKIKDSNYYSNTNYLLGTIVYDVPAGTYTYNYGGRVPTTNADGTISYGPGAYPDTESVSCQIQCDEVVVIEYGPPVASKAGLCFEYKVQVTSRVNCKTIKKPDLPRSDLSYCSPSPGCNHGSGFIDLGAGPAEEFDSCVGICDGGKYTSACTRQCYKQVYGSSTSAKKTTNPYDNITDMTTLLAFHGHNTVDRDFSKDGVGYYIYDPQYKAIVWKPSNHLGRWYVEHGQNGSHGCLKTEAEGGGMLSICGCWAVCRWNGCTGKRYLNPGEAADDYKRNMEVYKDMVDKCDAFSKCTTTTSEFSISTDYSYGSDNTTTTIYFPYTNENRVDSKNTITYNSENGANSVTCQGSNKDSSVIYKSNGCYECGSTDVKNKRFYQTEWGFPGTWMHNKTGEISYVPKNDWIPYIKSFCIPLDANDVNDKWWTYYYGQRYQTDERFSINSENFSAALCPGESFKDATFTQADVKNIKYNINAKARKFGQFGWNIDISCFYALNSYCTPTDRNSPEGTDEMRIRSIDLSNVFPAETGETLASEKTTGRVPGFNWSEYAINVQSGKYVIEPSDYLYNGVQGRGYSIYTDEQLDYEVTLTKDMISKLRNKDRNYTAFEGKVDETGTVTSYYSPLFRGNDAILKGYSTYPDANALGCNNIRERKNCEYFGGGAN